MHTAYVTAEMLDHSNSLQADWALRTRGHIQGDFIRSRCDFCLSLANEREQESSQRRVLRSRDCGDNPPWRSFASCDSSATDEISSVKSAGQTICNNVQEINNPLEALFVNETTIIQLQINNNTEMIASLNSTRPSRYISILSNLTQEIHEEEYLLTVLNSLNIAGSTTANHQPPCGVFADSG